MKKIFLGIALLLSAAAYPQTKKVQLHGHAEDMHGGQLLLTGTDAPEIPAKVDTNGAFSVHIDKIEKGFYHLGRIGTVYLEPGYDLAIAPDAGGGYLFSGKGSDENNLLRAVKRKITDFLPVKDEESNYDLYQVDMPVFMENINAYKAAAFKMLAGSGNTFFRENDSADIVFYCRNIANTYRLYYGVDSAREAAFYKYLDTARHSHPATVDSLYRSMHLKQMSETQKKQIDSMIDSGWDMNNSALFRQSPEYRRAVDNRIMHLQYTPEYRGNATAELNIANAEISNPFIQEYYRFRFTANLLKRAKNPQAADSVYRQFMKVSQHARHKTEIEKIYDNFKRYTANAQAPAFSYEDIKGTKVHLKDLRGKYVYIDVWATWCGPCKREIPFLSDIEDKYKGKDIWFVSLSVDTQADKDKWKDYVETHHLKGIQLIADNAFDSDFIKKFNINAIPRFILIAPDGKIVSANAKRPSDPGLQQELDKLL